MRMIDSDKYKESLLSGYMAAVTENDERAVAAYEDALGCLDTAPVIEAEPVVHAHWVDRGHGYQMCSGCGEEAVEDSQLPFRVFGYCPHCGAKMDEKPTGNFGVLMNYATEENGRVHLAYGNGEKHIALCDYVSKMAKEHGCDISQESVTEGRCMECDCPVAILYTVSVQAAELRAQLSAIKDILGDDYNLDELRQKLERYEKAEKKLAWAEHDLEAIMWHCGDGCDIALTK